MYLKGGTLTAAGQITGGTGGTSELCPDPQFSRGGSGGAGVFINGGTLIASATISGGQAGEDTAAGVPPGVLGDAVQFSAPIGVAPVAGTLVVDPGAVFNGQVGADSRVNDTLELAGSTAATLTGLGTQFTNFTTLDFAAGSRWTVDAVSAAFANPVVPVVTPVRGQAECPLPHPVGELGDVGRHAGEGGGIALDAYPQVAPEALQRGGNGVGGAGAQRFLRHAIITLIGCAMERPIE